VRLTSVNQHPIAKKPPDDRVRGRMALDNAARSALWIVRNAYALAALSFPTHVSFAVDAANPPAARTLPVAVRSARSNLEGDEYRNVTNITYRYFITV
jgi:hypothetical protein